MDAVDDHAWVTGKGPTFPSLKAHYKKMLINWEPELYYNKKAQSSAAPNAAAPSEIIEKKIAAERQLMKIRASQQSNPNAETLDALHRQLDWCHRVFHFNAAKTYAEDDFLRISSIFSVCLN